MPNKAWKSEKITHKRSAEEVDLSLPVRKKAKRSSWRKKKKKKTSDQNSVDQEKTNTRGSIIQLESEMIEIANKTHYSLPKKKTALLVGYCGIHYQGLQLNPNAKTIELKIIQALFMAGAVAQNDLQSLQSIRWMRCARTDKGVHAIGQVLSCWLMMNDSILEATNQYLPDDIKIFEYRFVSKGFHSQKNCEARTYEYLLRTDLLRPSSRHPEHSLSSEWKFTNKKRIQFEKILKKYEGTRKYHNFTKGGEPSKENVKRFLMQISVSKTYMANEMEFIRITLKGQSFLLNQIRKMIAAAAILFRDGAPVSVIAQLLSDTKYDVPMVPGLGLILKKCHYDCYEASGGKNCSLGFDCTSLQENFLSTIIEKEIYNQEKRTNDTMKWMAEYERGGYLFNPHNLIQKV